jgi:membrane protease YdiL (CAAX protease family)
MEPEIAPSTPREPGVEPTAEANQQTGSSSIGPSPPPDLDSPDFDLRWIFAGSFGLRAGWSIAIFALVFYCLLPLLDFVLFATNLIREGVGFTARSELFSELAAFVAMLGAATIMAAIERRKVFSYNLADERRFSHFAGGLLIGFAGLSALVGALAWGGWLRFGPTSLNGQAVFKYAAAWGCVFLLVACVEEGTMRCYLLFTLTRGINFWWALAAAGGTCGYLFLSAKSHGAWGVYALALLGVVPCWMLHAAQRSSAGFWQAAWVTSTYFAYGHTMNRGETWMGVFAAGAIGFVFCVSVKVTGSAWWAIGCHAAWDWAETFFYGTADSGMVANGHYFTTRQAGSAFWNGGTDGPEGSVLVLGAILLLLALLLAIYGRRGRVQETVPSMEQAAG